MRSMFAMAFRAAQLVRNAAPMMALVASVARAAWPPAGLPLATGPADQRLPVGLTLSGGDLFVLWEESPPTSSPLRAQRITIQGGVASGWPLGGRTVLVPPAAVGGAEIAEDGHGGALLAWWDYRSSGPRGIYAARVDSGGVVAPGWNPSGTEACTTSAQGSGPINYGYRVCSDGNGGAFVAWTDTRNTPPQGTLVYDVFAHHLLADGSKDPAWPAEGLAMTGGSGYKYPYALIPDGAGGFFLMNENPAATWQIAVTHCAPDGSPLGTWITPSYTGHAAAVSDGAGGVYLTWEDCVDCMAGVAKISVMRLGPAAAPRPGWPVAGVHVVSSPYSVTLPSLIATEDGAVIVAWLNSAVGGNDWYAARRVEANGTLTPGWPADGRVFAVSTDILSGWTQIARDGAGGAMFAFRRNRPNLFGSRVTSGGQVPAAFPDTGLSLCSVSGDQFLVTMVSDGLNGAYVLWEDRRNDPPDHSDLYVMRFTRDGVVGSTTSVSEPPREGGGISMSAPVPNPASGTSTFRIVIPTASQVRVEVLDLSGRHVRTLLHGDVVAGTRDLSWDGTDDRGRRVPPSLYLIRSEAGGAHAVRRVVMLN